MKRIAAVLVVALAATSVLASNTDRKDTQPGSAARKRPPATKPATQPAAESATPAPLR